MKKLLLSIVFSVLYVSSASAELGVNAGVSGNAGLFAGSASEKYTNGQTNNGTEHGSAGWASVFVEKTLGDVLLVGIDYVPGALETDTTETSKSDKRTAGTETVTTGTNKVQVDFEDLTTVYVGARIGENFYAKVGVTNVSVVTNESLNTGGAYGNTDLDGVTFGVGYNHTTDSGAFVRVEGSYIQFDGSTLTNTADSEKSIQLKNLDGVAGKISVGKSF
jgi:hypothetical protein